jgi:hypothetical protein
MDSTSLSNPDWDYILDTSGFADGDYLIRYDSIGGTGGDDVISIPVKFDNNGPEITNRTAIYNETDTAVSSGSLVRVRAYVQDSVSGVFNVTCNATNIGGSQWVKMYDDGQHEDGSAFDGTYGSDQITVDAIPGYHAVYVWARDNKGNLNNETVEVDVDNFEPTIMGIQTILPAGQTAIKNADSIRVVANAFDYKLEIIDVVVRQPLDVVLAIDNSGSMAGTKWNQLEAAATSFVDTLADNDRCAIYAFDLQGNREDVKRYQDFIRMDQVATDKNDETKTDIGRNLTKYVITVDDGLHLTYTNGRPGCGTPIWDTIGQSIMYAQNNHLTDHVPIVVALTDGDDWGYGGYETGSETFCPGAPSGASGRTWSISGGCYWGSPVKSYSSILRERDTNLFNSYSTVTFSSNPNNDGSRTGLINCSIPVFTVGLGNIPQGSDPFAANYINPATDNYKYSTEYDLREIGASSAGGKYYYAPSASDLKSIYENISKEIEHFGINEMGKSAPHGIKKLEADLSSIGISQKVTMFDDGKHGDASADDNLYGSELVSVNSIKTGNIIFSVEGTDIAGNKNLTINSIYLDNLQPDVGNVTAHYPPNRTTAQDGYSIFFSAYTNDSEAGIGQVFLDASNIGGGSAIPMYDLGEGNDQYAFDNIFASTNFTVTTGLKSGTYTVTVNSYDKAGNRAQHSGNIEILNDVDIIMANLVAGSVISGNYPLLINISDPDGIVDTSNQPRYRVDANPYYDLRLISGTIYGATMNTSLYLDGTHSIFVNAKDTYGAESILETEFVIDNTPPSQCTIINPINDEYVKEIYSFKCTAMDAIGIHNVTITLTNSTGYSVISNSSMGYNSGLGYYEFVLGSTGFEDGWYNATAYAHDKAGHETASKTITFNIDNTDPSLILNYPQDGNIVYGFVRLNLSVNDTFLDTVEYNVDNSGWVNHTVVWNTTKLDDGTHTVQIRAIDKAAHEVSVTITVTVDNHFPDCKLSQPSVHQYIGGWYTLRSYASDQVGIKSVNVRINHVVQNNASNASNVTITEVLNTTMGFNTGTGYYEYIFDTTILPDGNYTINVSATDIANNVTSTGDIIFYIDNHAPEVNINDPYEGKLVSGDVIINITIVNETFLDWIRYNIDGSGWVDASVPWDTTQVQDGVHNIDLRIHDMAGHNTDESLTVYVDNQNPLCSIVSPVANQYIEGMFTFKVAASDLVSLDRVTISAFGETVNATFNTQSSLYEYTVDTTVYADGSLTITAIAYDKTEKMLQTIPVPFHVDNHAPVLTLNSPLDGDYVSGNVIFDVDLNELFPDKTEYNVDNKGWSTISTTWNTSKLKDGKHIVQIRTRDILGHETIQIINVVVDNHDPICIIHAPIENQYIENTFTFRVVVIDDVGISTVELNVFYNTVNALYNSQSGYYEYTVDTSFFEDGVYNVSAISYDLSSRSTAAEPVDFRVDNEFPDLLVNAPLNGVFVTGEVELDFVIQDAFPTVTQYSIDSNGWIPYQINPIWNSSSVLDGEHTFEVRSIDPAGHTTKQKIIIYVDNAAPTCALHSPAEGQFIEGTFTFKVLALDELGIARVALKLFGNSVNATYNSQTNYYEYAVALSNKLDGVYDITITAVDRSGKTTKLGPISYNVDNNPPVMSIISPVSNKFVSGNKKIEVIATDAFETEVFYNVDGSGWVSVDIPWNTKKSGDGEHSLEIKTVDAAGHSIEQELTVFVDNIAPQVSFIYPKENDFISGIYTVKIYAADAFDIESVSLSLNNGTPMVISKNPSTGLYELPIDTIKLEEGDGVYIFIAEAVDKVFHLSSQSIMVYIDNSPPEIELDYPKSDKDDIEFKVHTTDLSDIDKVLINIDSTGWRELVGVEGENDTYIYIWRTTVDDNGEYPFEIKVIDKLGNEEVASGTVTVDNEKEDDYLGFLLEILPLISLIIFIIIIIIVFMLFRRGTFGTWIDRGKPKTETTPGKGTGEGTEEDLEDDEEFEFEFARGGASGEEEPSLVSKIREDAGGAPEPEEADEESIEWYEEEKPPSILGDSKKKSKRTRRKSSKSKKRRSGESAKRARKEPMDSVKGERRRRKGKPARRRKDREGRRTRRRRPSR